MTLRKKKTATKKVKGKSRPDLKKQPLATMEGEYIPSVRGSGPPPKRTGRQLATMRRVEANREINAKMLKERMAGNVRLTHLLRVLSEMQQLGDELIPFEQGDAMLNDSRAKAYALKQKNLMDRFNAQMRIFNKYCPDVNNIALEGDETSDILAKAAAAFGAAVKR